MFKYPVGTTMYAHDGGKNSSMGAGVVKAYGGDYAYVRVTEDGVNFKRGDIYEVHTDILEDFYGPKKETFELNQAYMFNGPEPTLEYLIIGKYDEGKDGLHFIARATVISGGDFHHYAVLREDRFEDMVLA